MRLVISESSGSAAIHSIKVFLDASGKNSSTKLKRFSVGSDKSCSLTIAPEVAEAVLPRPVALATFEAAEKGIT